VQDRLASQALFRAKLLAGEMPHEIEEVFDDCGTPLFPRIAADLDMRCSCPDWGVPCKHLAAVCYVLAEEFDRDPFGLLAWRGKGRGELLAALRRIQAAAHGSPAGQGPAELAGPEAAPGRPWQASLDVPAKPLAECLEAFWSSTLSPARLRALATAPSPAAPDLLLRMFPPPPVQVRAKDLAELLTPAYYQLAADDRPAGLPGDEGQPGQAQGDAP
jgi:uncharacterized Zn finger protein